MCDRSKPAWKGLADFNADGVVDLFDLDAFEEAYDDATNPDGSGLTGQERLTASLGNLPLYAGYWWDGVLAELSWRAIAADHAEPGVGGPSHADLGLTDPSALGLYHVRHRAYDPGGGGGGGAGLGVGRWLQRDPIGTAGGLNLYQYAGGDPLRLIDPMGLRSVQYLGTDCDGNELIDDSHDGVTPEEWAQLARDSEARYANGLSDFLAGIADEVTFGGTRALRGLILGEDDGVDAQSGAYRAGEILAVVASLPYRGAASAGRSGWRYVRGLFSGADDAVKRASSAVGGRASGVSARVSARASAHGVHVSIGGAGGVSQGAAVAGGAAAGATGSAAKACGGAKGALRTRMGNPPPGMRNAQAHHDLPQAKEFQKHWARTGLDIHDPAYGRWVQGGPDGNHQKWSHAFSTEWRNFFERNSMASREEILAQLERMRRSGLYE